MKAVAKLRFLEIADEAIDPRNGEILALANYPTYDLNERLHAGEKPAGRSNLAVVAPYEPGSVMKVITLFRIF